MAPLLCVGGASGVVAFPTKPFNLVVTVSAGGAADRVARLLASQLTAKWGQQVVVENRLGASGMIGAEYVARSQPDGYRALFASGTFVQAPALFPNAPYDPERDFAPVCQLCTLGVVLVVNATSNLRSVDDYIATARRSGLTYGSIGIGSSLHLYGEILSRDAKAELRHVPYKGEAPVLTDIVGGHIDSAFVSIASADPLIRSGKLRPLAVIGLERSPILSDVPTFPERGYGRLDLLGWYGVLLPKAVSSDIVAKLSDDLVSTVKEPGMSKQITEMGFTPKATTPDQYAETVRVDFDKWKKIIQEVGVKPE